MSLESGRAKYRAGSPGAVNFSIISSQVPRGMYCLSQRRRAMVMLATGRVVQPSACSPVRAAPSPDQPGPCQRAHGPAQTWIWVPAGAWLTWTRTVRLAWTTAWGRSQSARAPAASSSRPSQSA